MPKVNNSTLLAPDVAPGEISETTRQALEIASWGDVDIKSAEEIKARVEKYFEYCMKLDKRPMISGLCLALGTNRQSLVNWENEQSERGRVIRKAKDLIRNMLEEWSLTGKLSPPVAIFWSKNFLQMSDTVTIEARTTDNVYRAQRTPEEIARMIEEDIPCDDPEPAEILDI